MAWKQVLSPNLDDNPNDPLYIWIGGEILLDWYGWCLAVCAGSFGARGSSYSAKTAWNSCGTKHRDYDLPEGVWVPVWWEGGTYGHIAEAYRDGDSITVYSSPYTHKPEFEVFRGSVEGTLDYIGRVYGVGSFSGWSESLIDSDIIEWEDDEDEVEEPEPEPEPTPEPEPDEPEPIEPSEDEDKKDEDTQDNNDDKKEDDMSSPEPAKEADQQLIGGLIEEASDCFEPSKTVKLIAYLVGDALLVCAILIPDIVNALQAPNMSIWAEYASKVLLEAGTCILLVFKLIKKKK